MTSRELQDNTATRTGTYRGADAVAAFASAGEEFETVRSAAGLSEMTWQGKLVCTGSDRARWLNGMVTNNVRDLEAGHGVYALVLNAQGHTQGDVTIYNRGEYLLLTTSAEQVSRLSEWFDRYIIMDDVEVAAINDKLSTLGLVGPQSAAILQKAGLAAPQEPLEFTDVTWNGIGLTVARGNTTLFPSFAIWASPENIPAIAGQLLAAGAQRVGYEALELFRIAQGVPAFGQDIRDRELPQETGQNHALHFGKGCYIGQEIVERIRSRGNAHRGFSGFRLTEVVPAGTKLTRDGKELGELTTVAAFPAQSGGAVLALGYVRREAAAPGTELAAGSAKATVEKLPFEL